MSAFSENITNSSAFNKNSLLAFVYNKLGRIGYVVIWELPNYIIGATVILDNVNETTAFFSLTIIRCTVGP